MGDPITAQIFKGIVESYVEHAHDLEDKIEKLKKELEATEKKIEEDTLELKKKIEKLHEEGKSEEANKLGKKGVEDIVDLGKKRDDIKKKLEDLQKLLDNVYKIIGHYTSLYYRNL